VNRVVTGKRLLGAGFIMLVTGLLVLSVLTYQKAFTPVTWVTVRTDHTGLQLNDGADVKVRGVVVGEVRRITTDGQDATLRLALNPAMTGYVPANVTARLLPKTLFGEKYVELVPPAQPASHPIRPEAVIPQDRSQTALELERVLDDVLPLLQAIQPDKLATILGSLADALRGKGAQLGADIVTADRLLTQLNQEMPAISDDVKLLSRVLDTYDGALPDLVSILRDATVTARTVADQREQLAGFLAGTTDLADNTRAFLNRHDERIIQVGQVSRPLLELLAAYSPEYPCLLRGVVALQPRVEDTFAGGRFHITLEVTRDNGKYVAGKDDPVYGAQSGPNCQGLPNPAAPASPGPVDDGYDYGAKRSPSVLPLSAPAAPTPLDPTMGYAGTAEERALVKPLVAAATGLVPDAVPDLAVLLWGPLLRGTVVNSK
jgi:phospholipid/cholesterol/gamma-HCH transport system substrate-binding protein